MPVSSAWDVPLLSNSYKYSNFQCFLQSVTPTIHSKNCMEMVNRNHLDEDHSVGVQGFSLNELWKVYVEWSLYGAGVPILLNNGDSVLQYYCPSLSALQLYTKKPFMICSRRLLAKQESESWSHDSDEISEAMSLSNFSSRESDVTSDDSADHDHDHQSGDRFGHLYCQYNETSSPHDRLPLTEKIKELARSYPGLLKFHSIDLCPYSWMAIAWYPIYQIPFTKNVKKLSASFVTYHTLSSFKGPPDNIAKEDDKFQCTSTNRLGNECKCDEGGIIFRPFAVATYKMFGELWMNTKVSDEERLSSYLNAANSWLKQQKFQHHDFNFFMSRRCF